MRRVLTFLLAATCALLTEIAAAQDVTGALVGTVTDAQGAVLRGAVVRVSSQALIGGPQKLTTSEQGQLRFPALPPGVYVLDVEAPGFGAYHEGDIRIGVGATIERRVVLKLAGIEESVVVQGAGSHIEARGSGFETCFGPEDLKAIPVRRFSMFDFIRAASRGQRPRRSLCRRVTSGSSSRRAAPAGCRRKRCSISASRGRFPSAARCASRSSWMFSICSMTPRRRGSPRTICSARISASPRLSVIRAERWSV